MKQMNYLATVNEFHRAFQYRQPTPQEPDISDKATNDLREDLLNEELDELHQALSRGDKVATLDALCDLQYVLSGAVLALGFSSVFNDAFAEVHRSNCSKLWSEDEMMKHRRCVDLSFTATGERHYIARRPDGKIVKPGDYSPADLSRFV